MIRLNQLPKYTTITNDMDRLVPINDPTSSPEEISRFYKKKLFLYDRPDQFHCQGDFIEETSRSKERFLHQNSWYQSDFVIKVAFMFIIIIIIFLIIFLIKILN